ncbi:hypothetical protein, partial [Erwinia psidii]
MVYFLLNHAWTRYRPSLFPVAGTKAHAVRLAVCGVLCSTPVTQAFSKEKAGRRDCPSGDY